MRGCVRLRSSRSPTDAVCLMHRLIYHRFAADRSLARLVSAYAQVRR
ncbi:hypothetical protein PS691_03042 [Pseudomonas fluorescens]|uniref:Uncharacterized protein n=1 Tax=Pseudomonas fluorescens TaxID=294 RepID=A0A5E7CWH6_PSEFL|nr:hypothetical protein PS691_03042 [Pseudomonas fluorescens]